MSRYNERFMIVARRVLIGGRVQGVGFRMFAAARAAAEGIHGYARNLPDGRVEVLMEGDNDAVDRMELALRRGPSHADVESFDVEDTQPTHRATGFSTR
ncbi:MAG TPA: acylphosphatase [Vicinamibacterales bacterium]|jgi:acylphosphatase|nr:acylphosphatase [Vicinamibacterales bacterium]